MATNTTPAPGAASAGGISRKGATLSMGAMAIFIITNIVSMRGLA